jgi:hypothetical protein
MEKHLKGPIICYICLELTLFSPLVFKTYLSFLCLAGVNWALIRCTSPPEIPRPFELGIPMSNPSAAEEATASNRANMTTSQDTLSSSSSTLSSSEHKLITTSESYKAGEKGGSNRAAKQSSHSSGGSYLDFDFF